MLSWLQFENLFFNLLLYKILSAVYFSESGKLSKEYRNKGHDSALA